MLNGWKPILWGIFCAGLCVASLMALGSTSTRGRAEEGDQALSLGRSHLASRNLSATRLGGELCWAQASGQGRGAREERRAEGRGPGSFLQEAAGSGAEKR